MTDFKPNELPFHWRNIADNELQGDCARAIYAFAKMLEDALEAEAKQRLGDMPGPIRNAADWPNYYAAGWNDALRSIPGYPQDGIPDALAERQRLDALLPKLNIKCETTEGTITGTTYLNVVRVEAQDDNSFTAVTDFWPSTSPDILYKAMMWDLDFAEAQGKGREQIEDLLDFVWKRMTFDQRRQISEEFIAIKADRESKPLVIDDVMVKRFCMRYFHGWVPGNKADLELIRKALYVAINEDPYV